MLLHLLFLLALVRPELISFSIWEFFYLFLFFFFMDHRISKALLRPPLVWEYFAFGALIMLSKS